METPVTYSSEGVAVRRTQPALGAEISGVDLSQPLPPRAAAAIRNALHAHGIIFFRDQKLTRDQYLDFARIFAKSMSQPFVLYPKQPEPIPDYPQMLTLKTEFKDGKIHAPADTWHTDEVMREIPSVVTINRLHYGPTFGGDTAFSSAVAAYEGLDEETKRQIEGLTVLYSKHLANDRKDSKNAQQTGLLSLPPIEHPAVRIHPDTGQRVLFVSETASQLVGVEGPDGERLLRRLAYEFTRPEYQMRLTWAPDTIAVWDNILVQHRAVPDYNAPRYLERLTIAGLSRPIGPTGTESRLRQAESLN
ncbi:MAG: TauD/TfdA family dioxygenase [Hyphomonadaceae bacterium]|nr:TauD/TfdA family dioxygenase [Hyphomonadaceae bacterium]